MSDTEASHEVDGVKSTSDNSLGSDSEFSCCASILCKVGDKGRPDNLQRDAESVAPNYDIATVAAEVLRHLQLGTGLSNSALDLGIGRERREKPIRPVYARDETSSSGQRRGGEGPPVYREYYGRPRYDYYRDLGPTPGDRRARFMERDRTDKGRTYHEYEIRKREPSYRTDARSDLQQLPTRKPGGYKR